MLVRRLLSAAVGLPLLVLVVVLGGRWYDAVLAIVLAAATVELLVQVGVSPRAPLAWLAAAAVAALALAVPAPAALSGGILVVFVVLSLVASLAPAAAEDRFDRWSLAVALALYVGWLGRYLGLLRQGDDGRAWVLFTLLVTFASDTGAYAVGRLAGRHRFAPRISPGKTLEGAIGGLVWAGVGAVIFNIVLGPRHPALLMLAIGLGVSLAAQLGDLCESALKRRLEIKDAGSLVPGHGGLLDRLDSLLFTGPLVYYVLRWMSL
jgi:phosphatidate cytidylyltransferase